MSSEKAERPPTRAQLTTYRAPSSARLRSRVELDTRRQSVYVHDRIKDLPHHTEIAFVDVGQRDVDILKLRHTKHVCDEFSGEAHAPRTDDCDL